MNILAIDTSTPWAAVVIRRSNGLQFAGTTDSGRRHGRELVPMIHQLLDRAEIRPADLEGIAVGLGPGSYTGLRVGVMAAKTLAYATGAAVVGLDSLELLARNAPAEASRISVVLDAQRGDVHLAEFSRADRGSELIREGPTVSLAVKDLAERLAGRFFAFAPGLEKFAETLPAEIRSNGLLASHPDPEQLMEMAKTALSLGVHENVWSLEPIYARRSAAEDQWERLGR